MSLRALPAAAALFVLLTGKVFAEPFAYVTAYDEAYRLDLATRNAVLLGKNGRFGNQPVVFKGIAFSPEGVLYGASDNTKTLFRLDSPGNSTNAVGSLGLAGEGDPANFDSLDFGFAIGCDGQRWLSSTYARKLWRMAPNSTSPVFVGNLGAQITGIVSRGNDLYGFGSRGDDGFFRIDPATGRTTLIRAYPNLVGKASSMWPAFDAAGQLWVVVTYMPPPAGGPGAKWSDLAKVDLATGEMTLLGNITGPQSLEDIGIQGLAISAPPACPLGDPTVSVPAVSPLANVLLGSLLALGALFGLRRRAVKV
jgi:hypothetical protein